VLRKQRQNGDVFSHDFFDHHKNWLTVFRAVRRKREAWEIHPTTITVVRFVVVAVVKREAHPARPVEFEPLNLDRLHAYRSSENAGELV